MSNAELFPTDEHQEVTPTQIEFARLISMEQAVRTMRAHQKAYFRLKALKSFTEAKSELIQSKEWEKRVDKLIDVQA